MPAGDPILAADYLRIRQATIDAILVRIKQTVVQSIPNNTATAILFDGEELDPYGLHSVSSNTSRITPAVPGIYDVRAGIFMGSTNAVWDVAIYRNGSSALPSGQRDTSGVATQAGRMCMSYVYCNGTTDYLETMVTQVSGGALSTNSSQRFSCWMELRFTGRAAIT